jgi:hypothetical protein
MDARTETQQTSVKDTNGSARKSWAQALKHLFLFFIAPFEQPSHSRIRHDRLLGAVPNQQLHLNATGQLFPFGGAA